MTLESVLLTTNDWTLQGSALLVWVVLERIQKREEENYFRLENYVSMALSGEAVYMVGGEWKKFEVR